MSLNVLRLVGVVALLSACAPSQAPSFTDEERRAVDAEVRTSVAGLTEAMNAGDAEAVMAFYADDAGFSYLGCTNYIMGGERFEMVVSPYYASNGGVTFHQEVVATRVLGPDAVAVSLRGGSTEAASLFWTQVWERTEEGWVIGVEHESWPDCGEPRDPHPFTGAPVEGPPQEPGGGI